MKELKNRFDPPVVRDCIEQVLTEILDGKAYAEQTQKARDNWLQEITDTITDRVKAMNFDRYKIIVSVTMGQAGSSEAVASFTSCVWDSETDAYTSFTFQNDSMFCVASVYGIYLY